MTLEKICPNFILAFKFRIEDFFIISISIIIVAVVLSVYIYRMHLQNRKHTTRLFIELEILITDFKKAIDRVKLFKGNVYKTELEVHESNFNKYRDIITKIQTSRVKDKKLKSIFDIEKHMELDTNTIKRKIKKEIRFLVSYLQDT